ncbi:MAG: cytochrome c [Gammaproteobacteria bacterium]|nr:cytochrome c [Gammaproteobacteria bacterium]
MPAATESPRHSCHPCHRFARRIFVAVLTFAAWSTASLAEDGVLSYTAAQAEHGRALYRQHCASCHGNRLNDGQFGTPLKGSFFRSRWRGKTSAELLAFAVTQMPPAQPKLLSEQDHADVLAYLLQANGIAPSEVVFSSETLRLDSIVFSW